MGPTHLFLTDEQLLSPQKNKAVLPDLSEHPFPTELSDPADLVGLDVRWCRVLWTLQTGHSRQSSTFVPAQLTSTNLENKFKLMFQPEI